MLRSKQRTPVIPAGAWRAQYRQGRSGIRYWRRVLFASVAMLAKDRTRAGPAIVVWLFLFLLMTFSVGRHPSSLGRGLFITDMAWLTGYGAFSVWSWRQRRPKVRCALTAGAQNGVMLGLVFIASHTIEWFAAFGNSGAVQFVRGAGSVLLMLGLLGAAGSAAWQRTRSIILAVMAGLWCGSIAVLMFLGFAWTLNTTFEAHAESWLHGPFVASGMSDAGAFVVRNALESSFEIFVRLPIAALMMALGGSAWNEWIVTRSRALAIVAAWLTPCFFVAGVAAIWYAESLERSARPPFIMAGLLCAGIALCGAHPIWSSLSRMRRDLPRGT